MRPISRRLGRLECLAHPLRRQSHKRRYCQFSNTTISSAKVDKRGSTILRVSDLDETASTGVLRDKILKAPFQRVDGKSNRPPLFPWRSSPEFLPRLDPSTPEFEEEGQLLGGNINMTHPVIDEMATAWIFLNVPLHQLVFFRDWQDDIAENFSWAFTQGVAGILSNVYRVPMDDLATGDGELTFDYTTEHENDNEHPSSAKNEGVLEDVDFMVEENVRKLYQSAHEFGKHHLQVRLDCRPNVARMESIFVFPFLSRAALKALPRLKEHYQRLLDVMAESPSDSIPIWHELLDEVRYNGTVGSTVICQVLMECDEVFWVKDLSTGVILQGHEDEEFRKVFHLVRFEMVVDTVPRQGGLVPFEMKPGTWQITDIDDHLQGNLLL